MRVPNIDWEFALGTQVAQLVDGVDAQLAVRLLALGEHGAQLGDGAGGSFVVGAAGDAAYVRQVSQGGQAAADQVEAVQGDVVGGVGEGQGEGEGAQQGGLAGLWAADDRRVAAGDGQVQQPWVLRLSGRVVEGAERDAHRAVAVGEAETVRTGLEGACGRFQGGGFGQRGQPDPAYWGCGGGELADHDGQYGRAGLALGGGWLFHGVGPGPLGGVVGRVGPHERLVVSLFAQGRPAIRAGDIAGLEAFVRGGVDLEVAESGQRRQVEGVRGIQDGAGLVGGEGAQAEAIGEVSVQALELAALDALAGQQQVHADGAADAADGQEQVDEVRLGGDEFAELVDDDEQVGQGLQVRSGRGAQCGVVADVGDVPGVLQYLLAAFDLADEAGVDAFDEAGLVLQIRDHPCDMREFGERGEGGATLVVDQDQGQVLGGVGGGQGQDEGAQQLALAGAGGAHAQSVRAHAELRGLLEV
jgi:hypothetical protein